jgi:hypothetical protein
VTNKGFEMQHDLELMLTELKALRDKHKRCSGEFDDYLADIITDMAHTIEVDTEEFAPAIRTTDDEARLEFVNSRGLS